MNITRRRLIAAAGILASSHVFGQKSDDARIVVPVGPGGQMDDLGRMIAQGLASAQKRSFIVENRGGAAGQIAATATARSAGDPNTMFLASMGIMAVAPHLYPNLPYDVQRDFTPISLCALAPSALIVNPSVVPARTVQEFVQWARKQKDPIPYGSYGSGSVAHIAAEMFKNAASVQMTQVPYRDVPRIQADLVKGDIPLVFDAPSGYVGYEKDNRLRILAITSKARSPAFPALPTMDRSGFPGFDFSNWYALFMPRNVPTAAVAQMRISLRAILNSSRIREHFLPTGLEVPGIGAEDFPAFYGREFARWQAFIRQNDIRITT
ncbi:Bug family tripartite tricarboxylate transporter substrate binding protein [Cupriavidus lacunae]|nr:tripartite tricarboxylate transporter substrate-binding protein [Cupriavidus lacunae]